MKLHVSFLINQSKQNWLLLCFIMGRILPMMKHNKTLYEGHNLRAKYLGIFCMQVILSSTRQKKNRIYYENGWTESQREACKRQWRVCSLTMLCSQQLTCLFFSSNCLSVWLFDYASVCSPSRSPVYLPVFPSGCVYTPIFLLIACFFYRTVCISQCLI